MWYHRVEHHISQKRLPKEHTKGLFKIHMASTVKQSNWKAYKRFAQLESAITCYGYIDEWASQCGYNAYCCVDNHVEKDKKHKETKNSDHAPSVKIHNFHATELKKIFWFITIQFLFRWILADMDFCYWWNEILCRIGWEAGCICSMLLYGTRCCVFHSWTKSIPYSPYDRNGGKDSIASSICS
jgi:hypothetical protein